MKTTAFLSISTAICVALLDSPAAETSGIGEKPNVQETGLIKVDFALNATGGIAGSAKIKITADPRSGRTTKFVLKASGVPQGTYSLDGTRSGGGTVPLGSFTVTSSPRPGGEGGKATISVTLPEGIDGEDIVSVTMSKGGDEPVVFTADAVATTINWRYVANPRIEPGVANARGHVSSRSIIVDSVETKRKFLWVGAGAPPDTELTINVDGVAVGTVVSGADGKVNFSGLSEDIVLRNIGVVTLTRDTGAVVMRARFIAP